jgi:TetR/AcrR family transcriptional regulator
VRKTRSDNQRIIQREQTRQRLLDASLELFVYKGYGGTTIRDITTKAKVSPGLLFHYFESKEVMLREHIDFMNNGIRLVEKQGDPLEIFTQTAGILLESLQEEKGKQLFLLSNQIGTSVYISAAIRDSLENTLSINSSIPLIQRGQREGCVRAGDPHSLALAFWSALHGMAELLVWQPSAPLPDAGMLIPILKK